MRLVPLVDRVVLKNLDGKETTNAGIILLSETRQKYSLSEVIAVGPKVDCGVKIGDKIIADRYACSAVELEGEEVFILVKQNDIMAIVESN